MIVCHADLCHLHNGHDGPHQTAFMNQIRGTIEQIDARIAYRTYLTAARTYSAKCRTFNLKKPARNSGTVFSLRPLTLPVYTGTTLTPLQNGDIVVSCNIHGKMLVTDRLREAMTFVRLHDFIHTLEETKGAGW